MLPLRWLSLVVAERGWPREREGGGGEEITEEVMGTKTGSNVGGQTIDMSYHRQLYN